MVFVGQTNGHSQREKEKLISNIALSMLNAKKVKYP